jgi:hypothetical protein
MSLSSVEGSIAPKMEQKTTGASSKPADCVVTTNIKICFIKQYFVNLETMEYCPPK